MESALDRMPSARAAASPKNPCQWSTALRDEKTPLQSPAGYECSLLQEHPDLRNKSQHGPDGNSGLEAKRLDRFSAGKPVVMMVLAHGTIVFQLHERDNDRASIAGFVNFFLS